MSRASTKNGMFSDKFAGPHVAADANPLPFQVLEPLRGTLSGALVDDRLHVEDLEQVEIVVRDP